MSEKSNLTDSFNDASRQPAYRFERDNKLQGIAGNYKFPNGMRPSEFEGHYAAIWGGTSGMSEAPGVFKNLDIDPERITRLSDLLSNKVFRRELERAWQDMKRLNPELEHVKYDPEKPEELYHAVFGVASLFNVDDINFFIEADRNQKPAGQLSMTENETREIHDWIFEHGARGYMGWAVSLPTLKKIKTQMEARGDRPKDMMSRILRQYRPRGF